jgi:hypothetical protein
MASASLIFVVLIGMVLFNGWPLDGLLRGEQDRAPIADGTPAPAQAGTPDLATLLGGEPGAVRSRGGGGADLGGELSEGGTGSPGGGDGGSGAGQPAALSAQPPSVPGPANAVAQTLSNTVNSVQSTTARLGDALGGGGNTGLGGVAGGGGRGLNNDLQTLSGR